MNKPNTFIIGAPKCGTTSLAFWLSEHPQVFLPRIKEPHFFNFDFGNRRFKSLFEYEQLFFKADRRQTIVVDATSKYLYSKTAVPAIKRYCPDAKFIVMLRAPVQMAYALHDENLYAGHETISNFRDAWDAQIQRMYGANISARCADPQLLWYGKLCSLGEQLDRLFYSLGRNHVHVCLLEEMSKNPKLEYNRILRFLKLPEDGRDIFPKMNTSKERRIRILHDAIPWVDKALHGFNVPLPRMGLIEWVRNNLFRERPRAPLDSQTMAELSQYFTEDVQLLEKALRRKLPGEYKC